MADTTPTLREAAQRLLNAIEAVHEAEKSEGHARGGFVRTAPTRAHQRRVAEAWHENAAAVQALRAALAEQSATASAEQATSALLERAVALHEEAGMPWADAETLALREFGVGADAIAELVGECTSSRILVEGEITAFAISVLVHGSALLALTDAAALAEQAAEQAVPVAVPAGYAPEPDAIANHLARALFKLGGEPFGLQCCRIEFKVGTYPHDERTGGGFAEEPLAKFFASKLRELFAAPPAPAAAWPEWAEQILKIVREYSGYDGYDDADGVDLPEDVREALEELTAQIERVQAKAPAHGLLTDEQVAEFGALCVMNRRLKLTPQEMLAQYRADRDITAAPPAPARQEPLTDAARDVLVERQRQVSAEGWTPEHDDEHGDGSMSIAAACYALEGTGPEQLGIVSLEHLWHSSGWDSAWWKPKGRRRNLVKAAALMLAEIERLDRAAPITAAPAEGGAA